VRQTGLRAGLYALRIFAGAAVTKWSARATG
jgi:hypothetical protein